MFISVSETHGNRARPKTSGERRAHFPTALPWANLFNPSGIFCTGEQSPASGDRRFIRAGESVSCPNSVRYAPFITGFCTPAIWSGTINRSKPKTASGLFPSSGTKTRVRRLRPPKNPASGELIFPRRCRGLISLIPPGYFVPRNKAPASGEPFAPSCQLKE